MLINVSYIYDPVVGGVGVLRAKVGMCCICFMAIHRGFYVTVFYESLQYQRGGSPCIIYTHVVIINKCTSCCDQHVAGYWPLFRLILSQAIITYKK